MEETNVSKMKWEGKVSKRLSKARAEDVWPFFTDFFGVSKWFPACTSSVGIHGNNGHLGCIRKVTFVQEDGKEEQWCKESLIAIDHVHKTFSYNIVESNIGFNSYVATFKIVNNDDDEGGCTIEWSFVVDPIGGMQVEDVVNMLEAELQPAVTIMEDAATATLTATAAASSS